MITSVSFWVLLLVGVPLYWLIPARLRAAFLAAVSFGYLATLDRTGAVGMLVLALVTYSLVPLVTRGILPRMTTILVLGALAYLAFFKYAAPWIEAFPFAVPLGISYFTFKLIHYVMESARGNLQERSLTQFLAYMFLFPIFTGGPIERYQHYIDEQDSRWDRASLSEGLTRIAVGLIKRFVIAEQIRRQVQTEALLADLPEVGTSVVWAHCVLGFLYAYLDFSALSDIAIGASRLFGLRILENFNWPILAPNIGEFWKRWHMTLVGWCQAYVYVPMIGLTHSPYVAAYSTFLIMGIWHAGSLHWVGWGLYHATGVAAFQTWRRLKRKRKWKALDGNPVIYWLGVVATVGFVSGGSAFTTVWGVSGVYDSLRILAKLVGLDLPAP